MVSIGRKTGMGAGYGKQKGKENIKYLVFRQEDRMPPVEEGRVRTGRGRGMCLQTASGVCTAPTFIFSGSPLPTPRAWLGPSLGFLFRHFPHSISDLPTAPSSPPDSRERRLGPRAVVCSIGVPSTHGTGPTALGTPSEVRLTTSSGPGLSSTAYLVLSTRQRCEVGRQTFLIRSVRKGRLGEVSRTQRVAEPGPRQTTCRQSRHSPPLDQYSVLSRGREEAPGVEGRRSRAV